MLHGYAALSQCIVGQVPPESAKKKRKQLGVVERIGIVSFIGGNWIEPLQAILSLYAKVSDLHPF